MPARLLFNLSPPPVGMQHAHSGRVRRCRILLAGHVLSMLAGALAVVAQVAKGGRAASEGHFPGPFGMYAQLVGRAVGIPSMSRHLLSR